MSAVCLGRQQWFVPARKITFLVDQQSDSAHYSACFQASHHANARQYCSINSPIYAHSYIRVYDYTHTQRISMYARTHARSYVSVRVLHTPYADTHVCMPTCTSACFSLFPGMEICLNDKAFEQGRGYSQKLQLHEYIRCVRGAVRAMWYVASQHICTCAGPLDIGVIKPHTSIHDLSASLGGTGQAPSPESRRPHKMRSRLARSHIVPQCLLGQIHEGH
jgi:hypothetical protein